MRFTYMVCELSMRVETRAKILFMASSLLTGSWRRIASILSNVAEVVVVSMATTCSPIVGEKVGLSHEGSK